MPCSSHAVAVQVNEGLHAAGEVSSTRHAPPRHTAVHSPMSSPVREGGVDEREEAVGVVVLGAGGAQPTSHTGTQRVHLR